MTSFTLTAIALMPSGMIAAKPAPPSFGASFDSRIGSLASIDTITPRPTTSRELAMLPSINTDFGHRTTRTSAAVNLEPTGTRCDATAISTTSVGGARRLLKKR